METGLVVQVTPEQVAASISERIAAAVPALKNVWPAEPEELGPLPCATMLFRRIDPRETATGPRLDVEWFWDLRVFVGLSDWVAAQTQVAQLVFATLPAWRDDPTLGQSVDWWKIRDTGEPVIFDRRRHWLRKSVAVSAVFELLPPGP